MALLQRTCIGRNFCRISGLRRTISLAIGPHGRDIALPLEMAISGPQILIRVGMRTTKAVSVCLAKLVGECPSGLPTPGHIDPSNFDPVNTTRLALPPRRGGSLGRSRRGAPQVGWARGVRR